MRLMSLSPSYEAYFLVACALVFERRLCLGKKFGVELVGYGGAL